MAQAPSAGKLGKSRRRPGKTHTASCHYSFLCASHRPVQLPVLLQSLISTVGSFANFASRCPLLLTSCASPCRSAVRTASAAGRPPAFARWTRTRSLSPRGQRCDQTERRKEVGSDEGSCYSFDLYYILLYRPPRPPVRASPYRTILATTHSSCTAQINLFARSTPPYTLQPGNPIQQSS
jgi:hypothetical protein